MRYLLFLLSLILTSIAATQANVLSGWEETNESSNERIDHSVWQTMLDKHVVMDSTGQTFFSYSQVDEFTANHLNEYLLSLQALNPLTLNQNEQKAYWINLYNALTVRVILENYPVDSIRDIGGSLFSRGPWSKKIVELNGQTLSLNNIEHDIVRPKFNDHRIHYALNCAAKGCPNLSPTAFTGTNIDALLTDAATLFINHRRGVRFQSNTLTVSSIFRWYKEDFVDETAALPNYLSQFAEPNLARQLKDYVGKIRFDYDWSLNEVPRSP